MPEPLITKEPLRVRFPYYLRSFGVGLAAGLLAGTVIWLFTPAGPVPSVGYTYIFLGTGLLLAGSARGGGYTNLGLGRVTSLATGQSRQNDAVVSKRSSRHPDVKAALEQEEDDLGLEASDEYAASRPSGRRDPMDRLRRGLRPQENPDAFWQTIGGFVYLGLGGAITVLFG